MQLIQITVKDQKYYWNDQYQRWEGLEDNGTMVSDTRLKELMAEWEIKEVTFETKEV